MLVMTSVILPKYKQLNEEYLLKYRLCQNRFGINMYDHLTSFDDGNLRNESNMKSRSDTHFFRFLLHTFYRQAV